MLQKTSLIVIGLILMFFLVSEAFAGSKIKGQPDQLWLTPMGDDNIENTGYNRCRVIKTMKPGEKRVMQTVNNTQTLLGRYASELYFQAVKANFEIDQETPDDVMTSTAELSLMNRQIIARLANIANRLNIIVSLESRTAALNNIKKITNLSGSVYNDYEYDAEKETCGLKSGG